MGDDRYWHPEIGYMCPNCNVLVDCFEPASDAASRANMLFEEGFVTVHDECLTWMHMQKGQPIRILKTREEIIALVPEDEFDVVHEMTQHRWMEPEEVARAARARIARLGKGENP